MELFMRIAFYAPFKALDHPHPSGDQVIGRDLFFWLRQQGHQVRQISRLRSRWIYWHPTRIVRVLFELQRILTELKREPVDCWFTHHSYYKAPDLLGSVICRKLRIPYVLFQPSFATKYKRRLKTVAGYCLNRRALQMTDLALTNRRQDLHDLARIIEEQRLVFISPAISTADFSEDRQGGGRLRQQWQVGDRPVILTAAMFRDDVKSIGLARVIESCQRLHAQGERFVLLIAGDGCKRSWLEDLARRYLPLDMVHFLGKLERERMRSFYSAGDIFVFPGINESLGMVYLEAQACGLPVVAYENGGINGVVDKGKTGFLTPLHDNAAFDEAILRLLRNTDLRREMGRAAVDHVRSNHDLSKNYKRLEEVLCDLVSRNAR